MSCSCCLLLGVLRSSARPGRLAADQDAELVVGRAVAVRAEALAGSRGRRATRRSGARPSRRAPRSARAGTRGGRSPPPGRARRAAGCRSAWWRLPSASRTVVPWKPRSPTQCWPQAWGQPSRWSRSSETSSPNRPSRCSIRPCRGGPSSRRRRSCSAARRCSRSRSSAAGSRRPGSRSRRASPRRRRRRRRR